jgi:hypothetical protein
MTSVMSVSEVRVSVSRLSAPTTFAGSVADGGTLTLVELELDDELELELELDDDDDELE